VAPGRTPSASADGLDAFARAHADAISRRKVHSAGAFGTGNDASVATGAAGLAFYLTEAYRTFHVARYLDAARDYLKTAIEAARQPSRAFGPRSLDREHGFHSGVHTGRGGVAWVAILVADAAEDVPARERAVRRFERRWRASRHPEHLSLGSGAAGYAESAADLLEGLHLGEEEREGLGRVRDDASRLVLEGLPRPIEPTPTHVGVAHGLAGELLAMFRLAPQAPPVAPAFERLVAIVEGWVTRGTARAAWCNGVAGYGRVALRAHRALGDARSTEVASWLGSTLTGVRSPELTLCCGAAGHALALHDLGRSADDPRLAPLVRSILRRSLPHRGVGGLLFGRTGVALAALAVRHATVRRLPGMQP
jgi:serine/threonine-protein kinase